MSESPTAPELPLALAYGTFGKTALKGLPAALQQGVQIVDHAEMYGNAEAVGAVLKEHGKPVFLVSKLSGLPCGEYAAVEERARALAKGLGVESIDLLLMHWACGPVEVPTKPECVDAVTSKGLGDFEAFPEKGVEAWKNMLKLQEMGVAKRVGVSNFYAQHMAELKKAELPLPYAVETFIDCEQQENEFVKQMQGDGVRVLGYRALKQGRFPDAFKQAAEQLKLQSEKPCGLVLGWLLARGVIPIFSSTSEEHIAQNIAEAPIAQKGLTKEFLEVEGPAQDTETCGIEVLAQLSRFHGKRIEARPEAVEQLMASGFDAETAKTALEECGGSLEAAFELILGRM